MREREQQQEEEEDGRRTKRRTTGRLEENPREEPEESEEKEDPKEGPEERLEEDGRRTGGEPEGEPKEEDQRENPRRTGRGLEGKKGRVSGMSIGFFFEKGLTPTQRLAIPFPSSTKRGATRHDDHLSRFRRFHPRVPGSLRDHHSLFLLTDT